jgi:hypothetical protein
MPCHLVSCAADARAQPQEPNGALSASFGDCGKRCHPYHPSGSGLCSLQITRRVPWARSCGTPAGFAQANIFGEIRCRHTTYALYIAETNRAKNWMISECKSFEQEVVAWLDATGPPPVCIMSMLEDRQLCSSQTADSLGPFEAERMPRSVCYPHSHIGGRTARCSFQHQQGRPFTSACPVYKLEDRC